MPLELTSPAFRDGDLLPESYTCCGENISPPLTWHGEPARTAVYLMLSYNPASVTGIWSHWVLYGIPPSLSRLTSGIPREETLPWGGRQVVADTGSVGYSGPCPAEEDADRRIVFRLFALARPFNLNGSVTHRALIRMMRGHILDDAKLTAYYQQ